MKERLSDLEQKIEKLLVAQEFDNKIKKLPPELNRYFNSYVRTLDDAMYIGLVFFRGFDAISKSEIKMDGAANELVSKWVKSIQRNRSGKLIANFLATVIVATLEDFIKEIVAYAKALPDFSAQYEKLERCENEKRARNEDKVSLALLLKPSGKKNRWLKLLQELFAFTLDRSVDEVLTDMIKNRQEASHTDVHKQNPEIWGEHLKLWFLGARYLIQTIILAVHERMKKQSAISSSTL